MNYNLNKLIKPFDFASDPKDNIKNIKITSIRLKPYSGECDITIKVPRGSNKTIYELAQRWINFNESRFIDIFNVIEVELLFDFQDDQEALIVNINANNSYQIKNPQSNRYDQIIEN